MHAPASSPMVSLDCDVAVLRPWLPTDLDSLVANANDSSVSRGLRDQFPYPYTGDDGRAWLARAVEESDRSWAIEVEGNAVGGVGVHLGADVHRHSAQLARGCARESCPCPGFFGESPSNPDGRM